MKCGCILGYTLIRGWNIYLRLFVGLGTTMNVCFSLKKILFLFGLTIISFSWNVASSKKKKNNETEVLQASLIFNKPMLANMEDSVHKKRFIPQFLANPSNAKHYIKFSKQFNQYELSLLVPLLEKLILASLD